ncbi:MAG: hypothetical protein ACTSXL_05095 [Alphaproteobacteria bacterium]
MTTKSQMDKVMKAIDQVLGTIVWVNPEGDLVNLKQILHKTINGKGKMIEDLARPDLVGAYTCLQIQFERFDKKIQDLSNEDLIAEIKEMMFMKARETIELSEEKQSLKVA